MATAGASAGASFVVAVGSVVNPMAVGVFQSLAVRTVYQAAGGVVDELLNGLSLELTARILQPSDVVLTCSADTVYTLASFTFTITNRNPIPSNSFLHIILPS